MKVAFAALGILLGLASPAMTADQFVTDKPSPLKLAKRGTSEENVVSFTGTARLTGRFLVAWSVVNRTPRSLRVTFQPNEASATLLPHAVGGPGVKELTISNNEAAAKLLLDPDTVSKVLAKDLLSLEGEATATIGDYRSVIECDRRFYLAQLLSVTSSRIAVATIESNRRGC